VSDTQFQENRELLDALVGVVASYGRLPEPDEFPESAPIIEKFGSLKRAFALVRHVTGGDEWEQVAKRRAEDIRPPLSRRLGNLPMRASQGHQRASVRHPNGASLSATC
jgi:hypothetical protein